MITGSKINFQAIALMRGYTLEEVRACVVSETESTITVDETSPAYPREPKPGFTPAFTAHPPPPRQPTSGPGTELKKLLSRIGITATPTCSCNARAMAMNVNEAREPGWCEAHLDEIVGWLREEAQKRGLPFLDAAGRMLVKRAIKNARKNEKRPIDTP